MNRTQRIISALLEVARPEILRKYQVDSCIASSRIGMDVLTHFGILAQPLVVRTVIYNPPLVARIEAGQKIPETVAKLKEWEEQDGSWNIGVGYGNSDDKWNAHLVLICSVGNTQILLDLSLDQATRKQHNILLKPIGVVLPSDFFEVKEVLFRLNGCVVKTMPVSDCQDFRLSNDWAYPDKTIIQTIIEKIEKEIS